MLPVKCKLGVIDHFLKRIRKMSKLSLIMTIDKCRIDENLANTLWVKLNSYLIHFLQIVNYVKVYIFICFRKKVIAKFS